MAGARLLFTTFIPLGPSRVSEGYTKSRGHRGVNLYRLQLTSLTLSKNAHSSHERFDFPFSMSNCLSRDGYSYSPIPLTLQDSLCGGHALLMFNCTKWGHAMLLRGGGSRGFLDLKDQSMSTLHNTTSPV